MLEAALRNLAEVATRDIADPQDREQAIGAYLARLMPKPAAPAIAGQLNLHARACQARGEVAFITALAGHTGASHQEAAAAFDGLSTNLHQLTNSVSGWAVLSLLLCQLGHPLLVPTTH